MFGQRNLQHFVTMGWAVRAAGIAWGGLLALAMVQAASAADFPGTGHKFVADLAKFRFEQYYPSASSLTYTTLNPDGSRGSSETVNVKTQQVAESVFMVTWQEANKTTVVQIQDYAKHIIFANLTFPDGSFVQLHGSFVPAN